MTARIFSLQISNGGVPKLPVHEATLTEVGLVGDRQRHTKFHGGPERALCLLGLDVIMALQAEGHPLYPGSTGENVTISGLKWAALNIGDVLALGNDAIIQIASYTVPCRNIRASFADEQFNRMSQKLHPGSSRLYARVLQTGTLRIGAAVRMLHECSPTS